MPLPKRAPRASDPAQQTPTMLPQVSSTYRRLQLQLVLGSFFIMLGAVGQAVGFFQQWEQAFAHHLPARFLPAPPRVVMITLENSSRGFQAMDVAMALRGLGKFHPRCIVINGVIEGEQSSVPFLPDIISQLRKMPGLELIIPEIPSSSAQFKSLPLVRYSPDSRVPDWPKVEGLATPGSGAAYLPGSGGNELELPLFATTDQGVPIGSLWWWSLPASACKSPPLLLFGSILFLENHTPLHLATSGIVETLPSIQKSIKVITLDDFLFQMEQKDQGTFSPAFDNLWTDSTVILAPPSDISKVSALAAVMELLAISRLSSGIQLFMALGWIAFFLVVKKSRAPCRNFLHWFFSPLILLMVVAATVLFFSHGIILPFLPGIFTGLLLLLA